MKINEQLCKYHELGFGGSGGGGGGGGAHTTGFSSAAIVKFASDFFIPLSVMKTVKYYVLFSNVKI